MQLTLDTSTLIALAATVISIISLAISVLDFYLRRRDRKPKLRILTTSMGIVGQDGIMHTQFNTYLSNTSENPIYIVRLKLEVNFTSSAIQRTLEATRHKLGMLRNGSAPLHLITEPSEIPEEKDKPTFSASRQEHRHGTKVQLSLIREPIKLEPQQPIEIAHYYSAEEKEFLALASKPFINKPKYQSTLAYGNVIAYDGKLNIFKSKTTCILGPMLIEQLKAILQSGASANLKAIFHPGEPPHLSPSLQFKNDSEPKSDKGQAQGKPTAQEAQPDEVESNGALRTTPPSHSMVPKAQQPSDLPQ